MARGALPVHNLSAAVMFELGSSLREARRKRYLEALEDERFELLPGEVYTRGFLREYAEFLGLDGSLYVQEYNDRFAHHDELPIAATPTAARLRRRAGIPIVVA